jgi:hypothetical protein
MKHLIKWIRTQNIGDYGLTPRNMRRSLQTLFRELIHW